MEQTEAKCPYCDGEITAGVAKCRHCGEVLDEAAVGRVRYKSNKIGPGSFVAGIVSFFILLFLVTPQFFDMYYNFSTMFFISLVGAFIIGLAVRPWAGRWDD